MKLALTLVIIALVARLPVQADLSYTFSGDTEGFQNVTWMNGPGGWASAPSVRQSHTTGGWQMMMTKEFSWGPGGGSANQQLEMQALANSGNARISFDAMVDGSSFLPGTYGWFQLAIVGNSDGAAGWSQRDNIFSVAGWHDADDPTLITQHFDFSFTQMGWQPGDTWFQFWTGANSDGAVSVNFYLDNVTLYVVPEPGALSLFGGGLLLWVFRRR